MQRDMIGEHVKQCFLQKVAWPIDYRMTKYLFHVLVECIELVIVHTREKLLIKSNRKLRFLTADN